MKNEKAICKAVNTKKNTLPELDVVTVVDGYGFVTNLGSFVDFKTDLEDGNYNKIFLEKGLVSKAVFEIENPISKPKVSFKEVGILGQDVIQEILIAKSFVGRDELRPVMTGVFVSSNSICSTDAHRLYWRDRETGFQSEMILTIECVDLLKISSSPVKIYEEDSKVPLFVKFECDEFAAICRLIDGKYPNYKAVIPLGNPVKAKMNKLELINALKIVNEFSPKYTKQVKFTFQKGKVVLTAEDVDLGHSRTEEIPCEGVDSFKIGFNGKLMIDALKTFDKKELEVEIGMSEPNRAGIINDKILLMPIKLMD